jgi:N-acetylneuraminic acid mutarotase
MIIWGGRPSFSQTANLANGGIYNPSTDTWRSINTNGAPSARSQMAAVWTGGQMLIWGGSGDNWDEKADGYLYAYAPDIWEPLPATTLQGRVDATAAWTGSEMIILGGFEIDDYLGPNETWNSFGDGARYHYVNETWNLLPTNAAPSSRTAHTAVWTGSEMIVWGGRFLPTSTFLNTGARYKPSTDAWTTLPTANAPQARLDHGGVWTGTEMIVWGGYVDPTPTEVNTGAHYSPVCDAWTATPLTGAATARFYGRPDGAVWTGNAMFIFGGWDYPDELNSTFLYRR